MYQKAITFALSIMAVSEHISALECRIDVRLDLAGKKSPVILSGNTAGRYDLAQPTIRTSHNSYINLSDKSLLLTCPGKRNSLSLNGTKVIESDAVCRNFNGRNYFEINEEMYPTDKVQCAKRVAPNELITGEPCNGDGTLIKLGYTIDEEFFDLIQVCHRLADGLTYYSRHILHGSHFSTTGNSSKRHDDEGRPRFSYHSKALYRGFPPYRYFSKETQRKALSEITGSSEIIDSEHGRFFAKGHLSPNADFILRTWRDVTFLFVNVQPQWQDINGKNWNEIEKAIRNLAISTGEKYEVITGPQGILKLNNTKVYLDYTRERLPVPESFAKLVREIKSNQCITFITNNYPLDTPPELKCEDVCLQYQWPDLKDHRKAGYVNCCIYDAFRTAYPRTFPTIDCSGGVLGN